MSTAVSGHKIIEDRVGTPPPRRPSPLTLALLAAVVLLTLAMAWWWRWTADDAFINFRAVRNVVAGDGPVFNSGERVEVGTSPLWLWLLALFAAVVPMDVSWISVVLGAVGSAGGLLLACLGAMRINERHSVGDRSRAFLPIGALVFLAVPATWAFLTSGLETGLSFAWLGAVWFGTARVASSAAPVRPVWLLLVVGLAPLVRPDLTLVGGLLGLWLLIAVPSSWLRRVADVAIAAAAPLAYEVFRMGYFGLLVPNTAVAKESSRELWSRGWAYLVDLIDPYDLRVALVLCAALLALTGWRLRWSRRVTSLVAVTVLAGLLQAVFVVRVGGDFMHGRLLLPGLFQVLCPLAMVPVTALTVRRVVWGEWASVIVATSLLVWCAQSAGTLRTSYAGTIGPEGIADERGVYVANAGVPHPVTLEDHDAAGALTSAVQVNASAPAGEGLVFSQGTVSTAAPDRLQPLGQASGSDTFILFLAGYLGYAVDPDVWVVDYYGLTDPVGAHLEIAPPGRPGHEKIVPLAWFWARYGQGPPTAGAMPPVPAPAPGDVAAARAALACGELGDLIAATNEPLTWDRFWENLTGAVDRTSMRIPADPEEARDQYC